VWEVDSGRELFTLKGLQNAIMSVSWSPRGERLATASGDGTARLWEGATGRQLLTFFGHTSGVLSVSWSPDGQRLATGSADETAKVWEPPTGRELFTLKGHKNAVVSVSWSPDGRRLLTGSEDGTAKVWDAAEGRELLTLKGHSNTVWSVSWSPDGRRLVTGSADGTAKVWETATAGSIQEWAAQERRVGDLLARNAVRGPQARGFVQDWLLLAPLPLYPGESGAQGLERQQVSGEAQLRPRAGEWVPGDAQALIWREIHSPEAVFDFNAALGSLTEWSVAYLVCYLESDRARDDLSFQVASDDQAKLYLNGREVYQQRSMGWLQGLDKVSPVELRKGLNVLVFKVVNETGLWQSCLRFVDAQGRPGQGIRFKLTPEP
jgi:dipeptidyl aminopeptidase/acylaminoacyl peptidase